MGHGATRPIVPVQVDAGGVPIPTYAMFDSGASLSAINSDLVNKIASPVQKIDIRLGTFDAETVAEREVTSFSISNLQGNLSIQVNNALVGNILSTENEVPPSQSQLRGRGEGG